jgi:hypothetical protein
VDVEGLRSIVAKAKVFNVRLLISSNSYGLSI